MSDVRRELEEARRGLVLPDDVVGKALAHMVLVNAAALGNTDVALPFSQDPSKKLGIFQLFPTVAEQPWTSSQGGLSILAGQAYWDYHVLPGQKLSRRIANEGYGEMGRDLRMEPSTTLVAGVTYEAMADSAVRNQGFNKEQLELAPDLINFMSLSLQVMIPTLGPERFETAHIVWMDRDAFIDRFDATS
jgi:hypothetical protein